MASNTTVPATPPCPTISLPDPSTPRTPRHRNMDHLSTPLGVGIPPTPSPRRPLPRQKELEDARQRLLDEGLYLGDRSIRDRVMWERIGYADKLVLRPVNPPITDNTDNASKELSKADAEELSKAEAEDAEPVTAHLSAITRITSKDFFLTADGGYTGTSPFTPTVANVKPAGLLKAPSEIPFNDDYNEVIRNLRFFQGNMATNGYDKRGMFVDNDRYVKVRHVLFDTLSNPERAKRQEEVAKAHALYNEAVERGDKKAVLKLPDANDEFGVGYTAEKWPTRNEAVKSELLDLMDTHRIVPIPAYDMHGDLIQPTLYRLRLEDALVQVHFTMTHYGISSKRNQSQKGVDVYVADIQSMRVLLPPPGRIVTPRKRKVSAMDPRMDDDYSPKRQRLFTLEPGQVGFC